MHLELIFLLLLLQHSIKLTDNAQRGLQGSLFGCFEYEPYTALTIVLIIKTMNVSID